MFGSIGSACWKVYFIWVLQTVFYGVYRLYVIQPLQPLCAIDSTDHRLNRFYVLLGLLTLVLQVL